MAIAAAHLHLHERHHHDRSRCKPTACPSTCRKPRATTAESLTPRQIVAELDKYVIGQAQAKRAVAIALRNRTRRQKLPPELAEEIAPKNILMIGPTGVGKTEIARRLARLAQSPFIKVEASKFTEVGYVGRDVESMVRDLVELAVDMVREERRRGGAREGAPGRRGAPARSAAAAAAARARLRRAGGDASASRRSARARSCASSCATAGSISKQVEIDVREKSFPSFEIIAGSSVEEVDINLKDMLPGLFQGRTQEAASCRCPRRSRRWRRKKSRSSIDMETVARAAVERVEQSGHHLHRRDRQGRRPRGRPRPRRQPRRRAARHPADRRGHDGQHQVRDGARPITSCSSPPARSTSRSRRT